MEDDRSFETILERLLDGARAQFSELDTREGSLIYSALAPAAVELSRLYNALQFALEMSYADTASRAYLVRRAAERGMAPLEATQAVIEAAVLPEDVQVPVGSRFRAGIMVYAVSGRNDEGALLLRAESPGVAGNISGGRLVPVDFVEGLGSAAVRALIVPGRDEEETEVFRRRYVESHRSQRFGGNVADYREKVLAVAGVGGVRVFPASAGPGTVEITILAADYETPSTTLVASVQEILDPRQVTGEGRGWAPIGHQVTVNGAEVLPIQLSAVLTLEAGADFNAVMEEAWAVAEVYFFTLRVDWDRGEPLIVRLSQIETRLLDVRGVLDVADTALNGQRRNLTLEERQVPRLSELTLR